MVKKVNQTRDGRKGGAGGPSPTDEPLLTQSDPETEQLIEDAFPSVTEEKATDLSQGRIFAVIPEGAIGADPESFASFMEAVFEAGHDVERVIENLAAQDVGVRRPCRRVEVVVPVALLEGNSGATSAFLDRVFDAFEEIDEVLTDLGAGEGPMPTMRMAVRSVVIPDDEVGDPVRLLKAVDRIQSQAGKLELIFRQAKHKLKRLNRFRLSRRTPGALINQMRAEGEMITLQYLVEFLHSIHVAADSFERLEIPRPHIREYLEFLYQMEDWDAMAALVRRLELAVKRYSEQENRGGGA